MSSLSQFMGSGTQVGEAIEVYGGVPYFTDGSKEFLKTGTLKAYSATHANFVARCPYASYIDVTPNNTVSLTAAAYGGVFWDGTRYLNIGFDSSSTGGNYYSKYSTDLASWTDFSGTFSTAAYDIEHQNGITVVVGNDGTNCIAYKTAAGTTFTITSTSGDIGYVAANPTGTLWVACSRTGTTNQSNAIRTSTNASSWITRTGSGGTAINFGGIFWCPCASAFYIIGPLGLNLYLNKTTDGFTQTVAIANDSTFAPLNTHHKWIVASSPTVTVILGTNGTIKRTTDGTTWTTIDLKTQNIPDISGASRIFYNSVTSKFYLVISDFTTDGVLKLASSSDGSTWTTVYSFRDKGTTGSYSIGRLTGMWTANSKTFFRQITGYGTQAIFDATSDISQSTPDWVGLAGAIANKYVRIA